MKYKLIAIIDKVDMGKMGLGDTVETLENYILRNIVNGDGVVDYMKILECAPSAQQQYEKIAADIERHIPAYRSTSICIETAHLKRWARQLRHTA